MYSGHLDAFTYMRNTSVYILRLSTGQNSGKLVGEKRSEKYLKIILFFQLEVNFMNKIFDPEKKVAVQEIPSVYHNYQSNIARGLQQLQCTGKLQGHYR